LQTYISNKEELYNNGTLALTPEELIIVAQQKYLLMKTKGTFAKSLPLEQEIVAMRAELTQVKGQLTLGDSVRRAATGLATPVATTPAAGEQDKFSNKQRQKRDEAWKKVPPASGEPTTKKVRTKDFHWCAHHMAWTVHHPNKCQLKDEPAWASNAIAPPFTASAAAATTSANSILGLIKNSLRGEY
jgi:hypothetical protein